MVGWLLAKEQTGVRFSLPAQIQKSPANQGFLCICAGREVRCTDFTEKQKTVDNSVNMCIKDMYHMRENG